MEKSQKPVYHVMYWLLVVVFLTLVFGRSWQNSGAAFYFIAMLLPVVLGTSYFFNYWLVPKYFLKGAYVKFFLYVSYLIVISLYLEAIVLMISYVQLGNFNYDNLAPHASDTLVLAFALYLMVIVGSVLLMTQQMKEYQLVINQLLTEKEKQRIPYLEVKSNRKNTKIPYENIRYIESLSDYVKIHTDSESITTKLKISKLAQVLPNNFLRIHRSFIVNVDKVSAYSNNEISLNGIQLNIGRSYKTTVNEYLQNH